MVGRGAEGRVNDKRSLAKNILIQHCESFMQMKQAIFSDAYCKINKYCQRRKDQPDGFLLMSVWKFKEFKNIPFASLLADQKNRQPAVSR